ncbi:MAG: aldehyde dehydrogenase family protein, partial [Methylobacterium sp.]|nr:aldehyde dehydrogenase family protein [Methylobacterium sp.]
MTAQFSNFIAGESVRAARMLPNINPSNTHDVIGEFASGSAADVNNAVAAAKAAFPAWSRSNPQERHDILKRASDEVMARKDELGRILSREEGKTLAEGIGEATRAGQILAFFAGEALRLNGEVVNS